MEPLILLAIPVLALKAVGIGYYLWRRNVMKEENDYHEKHGPKYK